MSSDDNNMHKALSLVSYATPNYPRSFVRRFRVQGAGILTGNEIEKRLRGTEPRTEVIVPRIEQKIQGGIWRNQDINRPEIATITIPPTLHGKRITKTSLFFT
ncbi:unnamed protein product [Prunus armeniaca]|uniref:Uncharacterized protein n=1 Tax=Prunus armeniaca TaxID=36596 RepID=A0A6J5XZ82_PRUAR|nr:unnamed protein product [Prunus armeniaca]CAB4319190.1 unnamed protein product [Prunus armeniaca]